MPRDNGHSTPSSTTAIVSSSRPTRTALRTSVSCEAPLDAPSLENWREIVPHKPGRLIIDVAVFKDFMARLEREDGLPRIVITPLREVADTTSSILDLSGEHAIRFEEEAYALGMSRGYEFDTTPLRFTYSSMTTPAEIYDYDMATRERTLRKTQEVPSGHNPADYVTRRLLCACPRRRDGAGIAALQEGTPLDGSAPLFLYGYGAYGISMPASFSTGRLSLVDRGFISPSPTSAAARTRAIAGTRTASWRRRSNTFTDFIAAGEYLVAEGLTSAGASSRTAARRAAC